MHSNAVATWSLIELNKIHHHSKQSPASLLVNSPLYAYDAVTGYMGRLRHSIPYLKIDVERQFSFLYWERDAPDWRIQSFGKVPLYIWRF
ncbi:hypothetical protein TNCV_1373121 [Trichonephila clavipes]|uniref:Uncharacterized protein n=1 Tax=Trichonephila clavipes TaxID=2585209 RepID=A0A8X7BJX8_TRICX|nr:hypothetical protein TNCV_1373121 [Trichonephila clavipes]